MAINEEYFPTAEVSAKKSQEKIDEINKNKMKIAERLALIRSKIKTSCDNGLLGCQATSNQPDDHLDDFRIVWGPKGTRSAGANS